MQVFDLNHLLNTVDPGPGHVFTADAWYTDMMGTTQQRSTHNIVINEEAALAILVGCKTCSGGLLFVDISNPLNPQYAGCFSGDGYTHDAQCVMYNKPDYPDREFMNKQICFCFNEDTFTIVDATKPANSVMLSRTLYQGVSYCHQGWATPDMYYLMSDDELDEMYKTTPDKTQKTITYLWDIQNLGRPEEIGYFQSPEDSIDHNQYIYDSCSYQANYASGLRILRIPPDLGVPNAHPELVGYFDVDPDPTHGANFWGAWSVFANFPGTAKDIVVVDSIEQGLFVLHVNKKALGCEGTS
jgi:choice-of-anchor B domain-containing protein